MTQPSWRHPITRRSFQAALAAMPLAAGLARAQGQPPASTLVYVGTIGNQLRALRFDNVSGSLAPIGPVAEVPKARWMVAHPRLPVLYAAKDGDGQQGSVIAFTVDRNSGALARLGEVFAGGGGTTHLWLDAASMTLVAANFGGGSTSSIGINGDGSLGPLVSTIQATGSGPHRRQAAPHAHGAIVDPSGRYALVADLGADRVFVYGFDRATRALSGDSGPEPRSFIAPAGSGPRRIVFGRDGRFAYLLNELAAELMALRWDAQQGRLSLVQSVSITSPGYAGARSGAEVAASADGRFVYVADRSEHALVVYAVQRESGLLSLVQRLPSGGELPWTFAIHPSGRWLLVANERSNRINVFSIDAASGLLSGTAHAADSLSPVSVTFVE
jgi:6-phosphogluconolactonase